MPTYDLHGYTLEDAIKLVDKVIGNLRMQQKEEDVKFITGKGVIRWPLMDYLRDLGVEPRFELGNEGVIIVTVD